MLRLKVNVYMMYLVQISFSLFISLGTILQTYYFNVSYTFVLLYDYDCLFNYKTGERMSPRYRPMYSQGLWYTLEKKSDAKNCSQRF